MSNPALATRGHSASQPGLRAHSIGEVYPWRVVGHGDGSWAVESCRGEAFRQYWPQPGEDDDGDSACHRAHEAARVAKLLHPLGRVELTPWGHPANISGPIEEIPERLAGYVVRVVYSQGRNDAFHISWAQDDPQGRTKARTLRVTHQGTGVSQRLSLAWLAHNELIDVWLELR